MKVKELIEKLTKVSQDKDVVVFAPRKIGELHNIFVIDVIEENDDSDYNCIDLVI